MNATRQVYWNIQSHYWLYLIFVLALLVFTWGIYQRIQLWKMGRPENRWQEVWQGIRDVLVYGFGHKRILKDNYAGIMHLVIFWGFVFLTFATGIITLQADFNFQIFHGWLYLFIKLTTNLFGLMAVLGVVMAAYRRYILRPDKLDNKLDDAMTLSLIFLVLVTGFLLEGARIAVVSDPWANWAFIGQWVAIPLRAVLTTTQILTFHRFLWWFHLFLGMTFIAYFPYSKLFHILLGPLNQFFRKRGPVGIPALINFEDEALETYGVSQLKELSWKTLFDTDVCLRCGRCQDNCPAHLSGKNLNPKRIIQDLRFFMKEEGQALTQAHKRQTTNVPISTGRALIGQVISEEDLWACTTCRSCEEQCPVFIEHVDKTIEMRRNLVLMESRFPAEAQLAFRNMENNGNPWGIGWSKREEYLTGLGIPKIAENPDAEILYWPGCSGAYDARNQKVSAAVITLLQAAGVNFAILGNEEKCCGDSARKLGNEYLFQSLAQENIEVLKGYNIKKILTQCPHCFNMLKNEYPQLGGNFEVVHHTTYFKELMVQDKLKLKKAIGKRVSYHDSCYLGRYNQIYDEPRELLIETGLELVEMKHSKEKSFCCGAGGGRMWLEENAGQRINELRTEEAIAVQVDLVGTGCPFCLTMINDGINTKNKAEAMSAMDIAEILAQSL
ncbi:MAG: heterodisulfide reductase-related iron-sulfur binding cluster [Desulfitobacteriaceae bacterium]